MRHYGVVFSLLIGLAGCGGGDAVLPDQKTVPFEGTVTIDAKPANKAEVRFIPQGTTKGFGSMGITDATGKFVVKSPDGQDGLVPGQYKVTIRPFFPGEDYVPPAGQTVTGDATPLPAKYGDEAQTPLTATVSSTGGSQTFDLKSK